MKRSEQDQLLKEILAGDDLSDFRQASLEQGLVAIRRQSRRRRLRARARAHPSDGHADRAGVRELPDAVTLGARGAVEKSLRLKFSATRVFTVRLSTRGR